MKTLESMKQFIRENNFTALVNELVSSSPVPTWTLQTLSSTSTT